MNQNNIGVGERIKLMRKSANLTQTDLANKINKKLRTVQKYESGEIAPTIGTIQEIAGVLNVSPETLIGFQSNQHEWHYIQDESDYPPLPGRYLCIWKGLDYPDGLMDVLNYNGSFFPWERVYSPGRVIVTHWSSLPGWPETKNMKLRKETEKKEG